MNKARHLFRLNLALAAFGGLISVGALVVAVRSLELGRAPLAELQAACHRLVPHLDPAPALLLLLMLTGTLVLWRMAVGAAQQWRAQRRFLSGLGPSAPGVVLGQPLRLIEEQRLRAFCAGYLSPTIYLSTGALRRLDRAQLRAVLAHERHHQLRRDPLRVGAGRALAAALFFIPALRAATERYAALAELAADEAAVRAAGSRPLAAAMLRMGAPDPAADAVVGIAPERVDHLAGASPRLRLSLARFMVSLLLAALLLAATLAAAALLGGARLNLTLLIAQSCMPLMAGAVLLSLTWGLQLLRPLLRSRR